MSGFDSKNIEAGELAGPEWKVDAKIPEESAAEKEVSPEKGSSVSKRCTEVSLEEPPRKHLATDRISDTDAEKWLLDEIGRTPLHHAAMQGRVEAVKKLLAAGANACRQDADGMTPLHLALKWGKEAAAELISDTGAVNCLKDEIGRTPLHYAAKQGYVGLVRKLLAAGAISARCQDEEGMTPLHLALEWEKEAAAELISDVDADNSLKDDVGRTPLHYAAKQGYVGIVRKLLTTGANTRSQDEEGRTPLHLALRSQKKIAAELISDADPDNHLQDDSGRTPLHYAARRGCVGIMKKLLAAGADASCQDKSGLTPLDFAFDANRGNAAELILDIEAENTLQHVEERSLLNLAVENRFVGVVRKLLFLGAHPHPMNNEGQSAFEIAVENREKDIMEMIVSTCAFKNVSIDWEDVDVGQEDDVENYMALEKECHEEIQRMKEMKVHESSVSYDDVARKHISKVAEYLNNDEIRKVLLEGITTWSFDNYAELITFRVEKAERRRKLNKLCFDHFAVLSGKLPCLPETCIDKIFAYLTEHEMQNFVKAFVWKT